MKAKKNLRRDNKGIYHILDALLAGALLVGVIVLLMQLSFYEPSIEQKTYEGQDLLRVLSHLKVHEVNHSFITAEIGNESIDDASKSVLDQIGIYWALNETDKAQKLFEIVANDSVPDINSFSFSIGDELLFEQNHSTASTLVTGRRMISGIAKNEPISGYSSSAYLKKIHNKRFSSYTYFGGFVGQGNITARLDLLEDYNQSYFLGANLVLETPGNFKLYINGQQCGGTYNGIDGAVKRWDLASCNDSLQPENNFIFLEYESTLNESYVSGGYLRVDYTTDTLREYQEPGYKRVYLPQIEGFINLYDSVSVQGLLQNWTLNMSFYNEYDTYVVFGNETLFIAPGDNTSAQNIVFERYNQSILPTEIPFRIGTTNLTNVTISSEGEPADTFLVTDVSGSMNDCAQYSTQEYCSYYSVLFIFFIYRECPLMPGDSCVGDYCGSGSSTNVGHDTYYPCNNTMLDVAKQADHVFVDTVLENSTEHQIGLVDYSTNANPATDLTSTAGVLHNEIDTYSSGGATCTCCGINRARNLLDSSTNEKFMIVLSDGEPTAYCTSLNDYTGTTGNNALSELRAIQAAEEACDNNITVYAIGFGESMSQDGHDIMKQIACNESLYFNATNVSTLVEIYENISQQVLVTANYTSQTVTLSGEYSTAHLYNSSYIDFYFEPLITEDVQSRISLNFQSEEFGGCSASIDIPEDILIEDAFVTSFSGSHWTKTLRVNDDIVFNLSDYGQEYPLLGDPFTIQIPTAVMTVGDSNTIEMEIGDSPGNSTSCSANNSLIFTALINSSTPRSTTLDTLEGCNWTIESENGNIISLSVPDDYSGSKTCSYTNSSGISYNPYDAYDAATYNLLLQLDPDENGKVLVDLEETDLEITVTLVSGVPYLWGPSIASTKVWS